MTFTDEQYEILKQATPHFETARHEFIRNAPRWLTEQVINVYEAATGKTIMSKDLSCAVCVLRIYQIVGKPFYADKIEREKTTIEKDAKQPEDNTVGNAKSNRGNKEKNKRSSAKGKKGLD